MTIMRFLKIKDFINGGNAARKATSVKPKATTVKPKATTVKPKATSVKPKATTGRLKATAVKPKALFQLVFLLIICTLCGGCAGKAPKGGSTNGDSGSYEFGSSGSGSSQPESSQPGCFQSGQSGSGSSENCGSGTPGSGSHQGGSSYKITAAIFPVYDWTRELIKGCDAGIELSLLLDNGVDMHSFQPTVSDVAEISDCDMLIYIGGESDGWIEEILAMPDVKEKTVIRLMDHMQDRAIEEDELGQEHDHEHVQVRAGSSEHSAETDPGEANVHESEVGSHSKEEIGYEHEHDPARNADAAGEKHFIHDADGTDGVTEDRHISVSGSNADEHVWLSVKNAAMLCRAIEAELEEALPESADKLRENLEAYTGELAALDERYAEAVRKAPNDTLIFADRFPFIYLTSDYGLKYVAAFPGCAAETESSFAVIVKLAKSLDESGCNYICITETSDGKLARTVSECTSKSIRGIVVLDSMQSVTKAEADSGKTYLSIAEANLRELEKALS